MPVRNQKFILVDNPENESAKVDTDKAAVYGIHLKKGWKSWGNKVQNTKEESMGNRYETTDNVCENRNM